MATPQLVSAQNRAYELYNKTEHVNRMVESARVALDRGDTASALADFAIAATSASDIAYALSSAVEAAKAAHAVREPFGPDWCVACDDVSVPHVRDDGHLCRRPVTTNPYPAGG